MGERHEIRASDSDRQAVVERLSQALDEGRLTLNEYDDRVIRVYQSMTYGELAGLFTDLPSGGVLTKRSTTALEAATKPSAIPPGVFADAPTWIRVLWTVWLSVVSINLVVWLLVSLSDGYPKYFWPMWVAAPTGAGLIGLSIGAAHVRRARRAAKLRRGLKAARRNPAKNR